MAHFAKVENNVVLEVLVVDNEHEDYGQRYLNELGISGDWIQTSYSGSFKGKFAGIGDVYNPNKKRFEPSQKFASWTWDEDSQTWQAPTPKPKGNKIYDWDEANQAWKLA
jgi:hypothetical protein